jgi:UTP--glucose-1-phosphate uridylyltransferase
VLTAKAFIGNEPFVVMLGDDMMHDQVPLTQQLIDSYQETGASTLAVMRVPHEDTAKYGVIDPTAEVKPGLFNVKNFVEKPTPEQAPSDLAIIGRYLFNPEIFDALEHTAPGKGGEVQLTDAIDLLNRTQRVFAHEFKGERHDVGNKFGWLKTNIEYGLQHPEVKDELRQYLEQIGQQLLAEDQRK